jgi:hypothetical protein
VLKPTHASVLKPTHASVLKPTRASVLKPTHASVLKPTHDPAFISLHEDPSPVAQPIDFARFKNLSYDDFRRMAADPALSLNEKIGFPESYRAGYGEVIFADIVSKLAPLTREGALIVDIGPGCAELPRLTLAHAAAHRQHLVLIDAPEMLDLLPDAAVDGPPVTKIGAFFPDGCTDWVNAHLGQADAVLVYSVIQTLFTTASVTHFIDTALALLRPGGALLVGDIPNISKRRRFFASESGIAFHKAFMNTEEAPDVRFNTLEPGSFDDGALLGLLVRARAAGFDAYWLPQPPDLPLANRREDLLFVRP